MVNGVCIFVEKLLKIEIKNCTIFGMFCSVSHRSNTLDPEIVVLKVLSPEWYQTGFLK